MLDSFVTSGPARGEGCGVVTPLDVLFFEICCKNLLVVKIKVEKKTSSQEKILYVQIEYKFPYIIIFSFRIQF